MISLGKEAGGLECKGPSINYRDIPSLPPVRSLRLMRRYSELSGLILTAWNSQDEATRAWLSGLFTRRSSDRV
jgi:hypothetical protein